MASTYGSSAYNQGASTTLADERGSGHVSVQPKPATTYAVLFRTHIWDEYVERQYQRLRATVGRGDLYILVDETSRPVSIPHPNVVSHTQSSVLALGLSGAGHGNMLWFNGDYPLYFFFQQHDNYDFYIMTEYDVAVQRPLDDIVDRMACDGTDLVGVPNTEAVADWPLTHTCQDAYIHEEIKKCLICIAMFSNRAVRRLYERRVEMSHLQQAGVMRHWPYCEAFIPTEVARAGFKMAGLAEFGPINHYDWSPAVIEADLPNLTGQAFVHPVLDAQRFVQHTMKNLWPPESFFDVRNAVARLLRRAPVKVYGPPLARALYRRVGAPFRKLSVNQRGRGTQG